MGKRIGAVFKLKGNSCAQEESALHRTQVPQPHLCPPCHQCSESFYLFIFVCVCIVCECMHAYMCGYTVCVFVHVVLGRVEIRGQPWMLFTLYLFETVSS